MIALFLKHNVYFDANLQMWGGAQLRNLPEMQPKMVWIDEAQFFTPYVRQMWADRAARNAARRAADTAARAAPATPQTPRLPGINSYGSLAAYRLRAAELKAFYDAGGGHLILLGSDQPVSSPWLPAFAYHREMQAMAYAGLPPIAVLKAATINAARALGVGDQLGSIQVGKTADLVIVTGNPLADISAARAIRTVMKSGQVYDPKALLEMAKDKIGPTSATDRAPWTLFDKIRPFGVRRN
jgi:hypothetical protein